MQILKFLFEQNLFKFFFYLKTLIFVGPQIHGVWGPAYLPRGGTNPRKLGMNSLCFFYYYYRNMNSLLGTSNDEFLIRPQMKNQGFFYPLS